MAAVGTGLAGVLRWHCNAGASYISLVEWAILRVCRSFYVWDGRSYYHLCRAVLLDQLPREPVLEVGPLVPQPRQTIRLSATLRSQMSNAPTERDKALTQTGGVDALLGLLVICATTTTIKPFTSCRR